MYLWNGRASLEETRLKPSVRYAFLQNELRLGTGWIAPEPRGRRLPICPTFCGYTSGVAAMPSLLLVDAAEWGRAGGARARI